MEQSFNKSKKKDGDNMEGDRIFTEASLSDSFVFKALNQSSRVTTTISTAIKTGVPVESIFIEEQLLQMKKSRLSPLMEKVLASYEKGEIVLIYNKNVRVGTSLPFVVIQVNGKPKSYIFVSDFCSLNKDQTELNIEMKKLYVLMEAAFVGKVFYTKPQMFQRSMALMKIMASIYSEMSMRLYNKEFTLSLNKDLYDKVNYAVARFEMERMAEMSNDEVIKSYAKGVCNNPSRISIDMVEQEYTAASITNFKELISFISSLGASLTKLNSRYYLERWITTYGTGGTLGIDAFPYLYFMVINGFLGCFLVNTTKISDIIKNTKGMNVFYSEILKICI